MESNLPKSVRILIIRAMLKLAGLLLLIVIAGGVYLIRDIHLQAAAYEATLATQVVEDEFNEEEWDKIENGIHVRTGLKDAEGLMTVVSNCTSCHSAKLLTQNRMSAARWDETIKWMQETQGLWELGGNKEIIINYLVTNYPFKKKGRRPKLENIEWYELEN